MAVPAVTSTRESHETDANKKLTLNIRCNTMSDSGGDPSKVDRKREYNRNAQRVFRQRRKEHLKALEAAQREQSTVTAEEMERLRLENSELMRENDNLKRIYSSSSSSPGPAETSVSPPDVGQSLFPVFDPTSSLLNGATVLPTSHHSSLSQVSGESRELCVLVPHNIVEIRRSLHALLAPVLERMVISNPQNHLTTLAVIGPTLPPQLKPTDLQLSTPHHAYIDMIPSPSLRDRLISIGPAHASAFMQQACTIACEVEDNGQMIVWGEDWLNEISWEFSAAILEQWGGWLLTSEWRQRANFWRRQRGAPVLP